ncbi:hypothetical protein [Rhodococcus opacus]|nr:hypothetical protein [Rhodococcus opacus]
MSVDSEVGRRRNFRHVRQVRLRALLVGAAAVPMLMLGVGAAC